MKVTTARTASFGPYALDLRSGELRKFGTKVKMGEQPFQILLILLERSGEMVTRGELRERLWADDTFVDFDHGLNSAVQRLRDCLSDSAGKPRWIETLPRRGYRFIGQVDWSDKGAFAEVLPQVNDVSAEEASDDGASACTAPQFSAGQEERRVAWTRTALVILGVVVFLAAATLIGKWVQRARSAKQARIRSLAVLPLENLSGDPAQEYFADGMTDEVITMLAKNPSLRVTSRTSVMQYKKIHRPLREIAQELGVDGILEGSVARSGNRVHVTAQLIHAASDTHVWAESFDRDLSDVASLQNELAQTIAKQVGATTSASGKPQRQVKPEAHDAYMLGRYYWFAFDFKKSREYFQNAIDSQPDYAAAWSGLADFYGASAVHGDVRPDEAMPQAEAAAIKAMELDDSLAEAHNSVAAIHFFYHWNWEAADRESKRATELNPGFAEGHRVRSYVLCVLNRVGEAVQEERKAMELDPFSSPDGLGWLLIRTHQFDAALNEARIRMEAQPNNGDLHALLSSVYRNKGMEKEAAQEYELSLRLNGDQKLADEEHQAYSRGGFHAVLEWDLNLSKQRAAKQYVSPLDFANAYALLKQREETLRYLERAYEVHEPFLVYIQNDASLDFVHSEPRYRAIVKKMGLPPAF